MRPELKVHSQKMQDSQEEKYLGDNTLQQNKACQYNISKESQRIGHYFLHHTNTPNTPYREMQEKNKSWTSSKKSLVHKLIAS